MRPRSDVGRLVVLMPALCLSACAWLSPAPHHPVVQGADEAAGPSSRVNLAPLADYHGGDGPLAAMAGGAHHDGRDLAVRTLRKGDADYLSDVRVRATVPVQVADLADIPGTAHAAAIRHASDAVPHFTPRHRAAVPSVAVSALHRPALHLPVGTVHFASEHPE